MKLNLKKVLVAAALVCGASLTVGSVNLTSADAQVKSANAQKFYDGTCIKTPEGKIVGDQVMTSAHDMDDNGLYTIADLIIKKADDSDKWGPNVKMHKESILKDKQTIDVEVKDKAGQTIAEKKGINSVTKITRGFKDEDLKTESFGFTLSGLDNKDAKKVDIIIKDSKTGKVLGENEYTIPPTDTNCPKFVGANEKEYGCDRLVINYDGEEGKKNWLIDVVVRNNLKGSFLKNYVDKNLNVKLTNKATNETIELTSPLEKGKYGGESSEVSYLDIQIEGSKLADGVYNIYLFDGTTLLGGFKDVELNSATAPAGLCG